MSSNDNNNKDFVAISLNDSSTSYPPNSKLFCNLCSCNLILLDAQTEKWFCTRCNITYYPTKEKVKRPNKLMTLPRSFQVMERHGLRITSYTTTEDR
jgi:hypothetical protein